jgi:hypothetical protein
MPFFIFYRVVLKQELLGINAARATRSRFLPTVLTPEEVLNALTCGWLDLTTF